MDLAWQKFRAAALLLARSGTVKERLYAAYRHQLCDLDADTLPGEVREDFCALMRALTRERPLRGEDAAVATIRKLSASEADQCATLLIEIFARMSNLNLLEDVTVVPSSGTAQVIPLFAAESRG